jgi:hypothetical protein
MVGLIYLGLNHIFDMIVVFMVNYSFSGRWRPVDNKVLLVIDFVNLKIKPAQYFRCAHRDSVYIHMFIGVSAHTYISICIYTVF